MKKIDIATWKRKTHYKFFAEFEEPYFGITSHVDVTNALKYCKENKISFFQYYLHKTLVAVNSIENLRYRIHENGDVFLYDAIAASATIMRPDETFGFSHIPFEEGFYAFAKAVQAEIQRIHNSQDLFPENNGLDVVHCSAIPWLNFTSITHSRIFKAKDSVPKFSYGKAVEKDGKMMMPVAIYVHHGLVDGLHVSRFFEAFQKLLNQN